MKNRVILHFEELLGAPHASMSDNSGHFIVSSLRDEIDETGSSIPFWAFKRKDAFIASVSPRIAEALPLKLHNFTFESISEKELSLAIHDAISGVIPLQSFHTAYHFQCDVASFRPAIVYHVRNLAKSDLPALTSMEPGLDRQLAEPIEKESAFGFYDEDRILSCAWVRRYTSYAWDLFAYTLPEHRQRGFGKKVVTVAVKSAFNQGKDVVMTVRARDKSALSFAESLGFNRYAKSLLAVSKPLPPE